MLPTSVWKRLCVGYLPALSVVLLFWVVIGGLWYSDSVPRSLSQVLNRPLTSTLPPIGSHMTAEEVIAREEALQRKEEELTLREQKLLDEGCPAVNGSVLHTPRALISYAYNETPSNRRNLKFFIQHGLFKSADWIFSFNGETDAEELLPNHLKSPWHDAKFTNIEIIKRENRCFDFGAHTEALLREWSADGTQLYPMKDVDKGGQKFWQRYDRFILMNASVRGPFLPHWSQKCWSDAFWALLSETTKLVGMSYNCHEGEGHLQSMVWATDRTGLSLLLQPAPIGIGYWCPADMVNAIYGEIRSTPAILNAGYEVDALVSVYHSHDGDDLDGDGKPDHKVDGYRTNCQDEDFFHENAYYGFNVHPYETIFMKSARNMQEALLGNLTAWVDGSGYSSYEMCDLSV